MGADVGVVGLGKIGNGAAFLAVQAGYRVRGYDPREEAREEFARFGGIPVQSPAEAAEDASCVLVAVYDDQQVRDVFESAQGVLAAPHPPSAAVVLSTVTVETVRREHDLARAQGIALLDCGVSGGKLLRARQRMAASVGGSETAFAAVRPVLETFGDPVVYMGAVGSGMMAKIARNMLHFSSVLADFESLQLAGAAGLDPDAFREFVMAADAYSGGRMGYGSDGDISRSPSFLGYGVKDLAVAMELAEQVGADVPAAAAAAAAYLRILDSATAAAAE